MLSSSDDEQDAGGNSPTTRSEPLRINKEYAKKYKERKDREELQKRELCL